MCAIVVHVVVLTISEQRAVGLMSFVLSGYRATITLRYLDKLAYFRNTEFLEYWAFGTMTWHPNMPPLATPGPVLLHLMT